MSETEEIIVYKLLKIYENPEFRKLQGELQEDAMICDSCFRENQNFLTLVKYQFVQDLEVESEIWITKIKEGLIELAYNLENNENITAEIFYPLELTESIPICEYYTVYWCKPGLWWEKCPIIIINVSLNENNYRIKGTICKMEFTKTGRIKYRIKITSCNCFLSQVLDEPDISAKIKIIPPKLTDSFGRLRTGTSLADKYTI